MSRFAFTGGQSPMLRESWIAKAGEMHWTLNNALALMMEESGSKCEKCRATMQWVFELGIIPEHHVEHLKECSGLAFSISATGVSARQVFGGSQNV